MKKSNSKLIYMLIIVFLSCIIGMLSGSGLLYTIIYKDDEVKVSNVKEIDEIYNKIVNEYYDTVDKDKIIEAAVSGMLSALDTHTVYMSEETKQSFYNKMKGEYYGIGVETLTLAEDGVLIVNVISNSPAERSGLKSGDIIISVNEESLKNKGTGYFSSLVANTESELDLIINRDNRDLDISVKPEKVIISTVTSDMIQIENKKIGYIKISLFAANTASQFSTQLEKLEANGINSLIIDVRNNSGGYLSNVSTILELFMKRGDILYKTEVKDNVSVRKDNTDDYRDYPVNILVNSSSASASEILAACFKDNKNSKVIGVKTYGKGTVQETINLADGGMAKITTKKWLTPKGEWINGKGVIPTIEVNLSDEYMQNPVDSNDNQLQTAINNILKK